MKIVFGAIPDAYDVEDAFMGQGKDGVIPFYYLAEIDNEGEGNGTFKLSDTCGRMLPFDFGDIDDLLQVLTTLKAYRDDQKEFNSYWNTVWAGQGRKSST